MPPGRRLLAACAVGVLTLTAGVRSADPAAPPAAAPATPPLTFRLTDTTGAVHTERELAGASAVVLFFIAPDCPISQGYVPEMNRIGQAYASRGVRVFAVQSDPAASDSAVRQHVTEYRYAFPVLSDRRQQLIAHTGATVTPEAALMTPAGTLLYRGRIDNRVVSLGVRKPSATQFDLRVAIDAALAGRAPSVARTTAVGCTIVRTR